MCGSGVLGRLLPHLSGVVIESIKRTAGVITLRAGCQTLPVRCPGCGMPSWRVHGRYVRRLGDAPVAGSRVVIELTVRRFKCLSSRCPAVTFAEQIEGLTRPHARQTQVLRSMLASIALCLAGRPGARLAAALGIRIAKDALLDLLHSVPQPPVGAVRFLGVDDFALRKGDSYATILVDLEARRPVDVLPGRDAEPLAAWLRRHPEVEVICRDRAGAYAEGARNGAPQAMQVADAWHLWRNIAEAVERTVGSHHGCIQTAFAEPPVIAETTAKDLVTPEPSRPLAVPFVPPDGTLDVSGQPRRLVARTTERYAAVQALLAEGKSLAAIGRTLRLDHSTVRRFARATSLDELLAKATGRLSVLDEHALPPRPLAGGLSRHSPAPPGTARARIRRERPVPPPLLPRLQTSPPTRQEAAAGVPTAARAGPEIPTRRPLNHDEPPAPRGRRRRGTEGDPYGLPSPRRRRTARPRLR
ncbi:ISL3 family transposase [Streptomyces sp. NPDC001513]|uniref:ISL3 family transposase n=1 Tax=Streptomyces sp. NPDC001513 TaxID=3364580 RepID=UPI0036765B02